MKLCALWQKTKYKMLHNLNKNWNDYFKINKMTYKFLFTWDKFMYLLLLNQPGFTYGACRASSKQFKEFQILERQVISNIYIEMN